MGKKRFVKLRSPDGKFRVYDSVNDDVLDGNKVVFILNYLYYANTDLEDRCIMLQKSLNYWLNKYKEGTETFEVIE